MFSFATPGGDQLSLKPEGTAGVVRAVVQHRLYAGQLPLKLWYSGSYYRYERPQAGRYRHFSQVAPKRSAWTTRRLMPNWSPWVRRSSAILG